MKKSEYLTINENAPPAVRIWYMRDRTGLTQHQLAERLKCNDLTVRQWEIGRYTPRAYQFKAMSELFGCSVSWLMGPTETNTGGMDK